MPVYYSVHDLIVDRPAFAHIGIDESILIETALESFRWMSQPGAVDYVGSPGDFARFGAVRSIRLQLLEQGWTIDNEDNAAWVISPDESIRIGVSAGECVGLATSQPRTRYVRGATFERAVSSNTQLSFFQATSGAQAPQNPEDMETWMFLFQHDLETEQTLLELSRPISVVRPGTRNPIIFWEDRWLIPAIDHNTILGDENDSDNESDNFDFDVNIRSND